MDLNESFVPSEWEDVQAALRQAEQDVFEDIRTERVFEVIDSVRLELSDATLLQRLQASQSSVRVKCDHESLGVVSGKIGWANEKFFSVIQESVETIVSFTHVTAVYDLGKHIYHRDEQLTLLLSHDSLWLSELIESRSLARWFIHPDTVFEGRCLSYGADWIDVNDAVGTQTIPLGKVCAVQMI